MPVHHNDLASGWVAGRSGALYGLVFREVLSEGARTAADPGARAAASSPDGDERETLLVRLLAGAPRRGEFVPG